MIRSKNAQLGPFQRCVGATLRMQPDPGVSSSHPLLGPVSMSAPSTTGRYVLAKFPGRNLVHYVFS
jgi:hypothetical protein